MSDNAFRGTLLLLQNRTRRDPESYRDEFLAQLEHFKAASTSVAAQRVANPQYIAVLHYLAHVCHCFSKEASVVAHIVLELLRSSKGNTFPHELCVSLVKCAVMLHTKDIVSIDDIFPIFFTLLQERDKLLRKIILSHIVTNIRRINMRRVANRANQSTHHHSSSSSSSSAYRNKGTNAAQVNRRAQNFLFHVMDEDDAVQARCAEMVLIDLYRRRVWCEERTVEVLTRACFSKHTPILRTALRFFLMQMPKIASMENHDGGNDSDADDDVDPGRSISKLKQKMKIVKKTGKRERVLQRNMRHIKRRYNHSQKEEEALAKQHVDPVRLLRDPQQFVERLFARLQRTSERFEVRVLYLHVIARTVMEHEIVHLPLYPFLERYLEPSQLHATQLLALATLCVHRMVPPDAVEPLVRALANHFVSDRSAPDAITIGLNTIREMCKRQPFAITADLLKDLVEYKNHRGDRGVVMAARALMQLYREVYPALLPSKLRGSQGQCRATNPPHHSSGRTPSSASVADSAAMVRPVYGAEVVYKDIPGLELLYKAVPQDMYSCSVSNGKRDGNSLDRCRRSASCASASDAHPHCRQTTRSSSSNSSDSHIAIDSEEDESGEWATDSDGSIASDDVDGDYVAVSDADAGDDEAEEEEEEENIKCPRLVGLPLSQPDNSNNRGNDDTPRLPNSTLFPMRKRVKADAPTGRRRAATDEESDSEGESATMDETESVECSTDEVMDSSEAYEAETSERDASEMGFVPGGTREDPIHTTDDTDGNERSTATRSKSIADAETDWFVDLKGSSEHVSCGTRHGDVCPASSMASSSLSVSAMRILTDEDFENIRKLHAQQGGHQSLRGKAKDRAAYSQKRYGLIHGISSDLSAHDIEHFTMKKREEDKLDKIARTESLRKASSKFEIRKKTKSKLNSTHGEHAKKGKLFQMTKRSQRVAVKLRSSASDRSARAREMQKKDIKFRIKRGWKA